MGRAYALIRLLEHGPLTWRELVEITGWKHSTVASALAVAMDKGEVQKLDRRDGVYVYGRA